MKSLIVSNRDAFYESREQKLGYEPTKIWRGLVTIVIVLVVIFRVGSRCDSNNTNSNFYDYQELINNMQKSQQSNVPIDFDSAQFENVHEDIVEALKTNNYVVNSYISQGEPSLISPFKLDTNGVTYQLTNETFSEMLMLVSEGSSLNWYYIPVNDTVQITLNQTASAFFYSGKKWNVERTVQAFIYDPVKMNSRIIQFNGYFSHLTDKDIGFRQRLFTLTYGFSEDFSIKMENNEYVLYQGGRLVSYSL